MIENPTHYNNIGKRGLCIMSADLDLLLSNLTLS